MADEAKGLTRKQQAEHTKRMLFEKGCQILEHVDNPDSFVVEDITDACGVSKGTFYLYFKSKGAFFYNVKHALVQKVVQELVDILNDTSEPAREVILKFVRSWVHRYQDFGIPIGDKLLAMARNAESTDAVPRGVGPRRFEDMLQRQLAVGVERGEFVNDAPVERMASLLVITLTGFAVFIYANEDKLDFDEWAEEAVKLVDNGVLRPWISKRRGHRRGQHRHLGDKP